MKTGEGVFRLFLQDPILMQNGAVFIEKIPYLVLEYDMVPYLAPKDKIFSI